MFRTKKEPTIIDVVKSMKRKGYQYQEIHHILTSAGIPEEEAEKLLKRIEHEFTEKQINPQKDIITKELEKILKNQIKQQTSQIKSQIKTLKHKIRKNNTKIENLNNRTKEIQKSIHKQDKRNDNKIKNTPERKTKGR